MLIPPFQECWSIVGDGPDRLPIPKSVALPGSTGTGDELSSCGLGGVIIFVKWLTSSYAVSGCSPVNRALWTRPMGPSRSNDIKMKRSNRYGLRLGPGQGRLKQKEIRKACRRRSPHNEMERAQGHTCQTTRPCSDQRTRQSRPISSWIDSRCSAGHHHFPAHVVRRFF